jgi:hypothetical protein
MGFLDRFRGKKKVKDGEGVATYVLKRRTASGGMEKVLELKEPATIESLYESLSPGIYCLHKYQKGQSGFDQLWQAEVLGEEPKEGATRPTLASPFAGLRKYAEDMKAAQDDLKATFEVLGPMAGFKKAGESSEDEILNVLETAKKKKERYENLFPSATTDSQKIPISGSIPAVVAYAPTLIDQSLDSVEKRLKKWGLVEEVGSETVEHKEIIKMPEKPKRAMEKKAEEEAKKEEDEAGTLKLPPKPEAKAEVKKVNIEEEKKTEEEKEDGKRTEKSGK